MVFFGTKKREVFKCSSHSLRGCSVANNGGLEGDKYRKVLFIEGAHQEGRQCVVANFFVKYTNCYGCIIIQTLLSAFVKAAGQAYEVSRSAANAVALVCMMIWIAFFVFKNVTSFSAVEPMKLLQEFLVQCAKVVFALIIINSGINTILHYTLVPVLELGIDMANTISASTNNLGEKFSGGSND